MRSGGSYALNPVYTTNPSFEKGLLAEAIVPDAEPPADRREDSAGVTAPTFIEGASESRNDGEKLPYTIYSPLSKSYSVTWFRDGLGIWRAREISVPKLEDVSIPLSYNRLDSSGIVNL